MDLRVRDSHPTRRSATARRHLCTDAIYLPPHALLLSGPVS
jgi:hypothetical protein